MRSPCVSTALILACQFVGSASAQAARPVAQEGHVDKVDIALMAPDGRTMATLGDDRRMVWETASGGELMRLTPADRGVELVGFAA